MFEVVKAQFGYVAGWISADTLATWTGLVLFKNPTQAMQISGFGDYDPQRWEMEYKAGDLIGLKERVDARATEEIVAIDGVSYYVRAVDSIFDGQTFKATLSPVDP